MDVAEGKTVAVFGPGAMGLSAIMAAMIVATVDLKESRLETARKLGATHTIFGGRGKTTVGQIRELCLSARGVDFAIDTTGSVKVIGDMIKALGAKGKALTIGAPKVGACVELDVNEMIEPGKQHMGCGEGDSVPQEVGIRLPHSLLPAP